MTLPDPARPLDEDAAADAFDRILSGAVDDAAIARFLVGLAERGETAAEIATAAAALRARMIGISAPEGAIDVCGTGGDGAHSLNVSTAVSFVVAACGVPVAKHGNRAASSRSGAADVLSALGWAGDLPFARLEACLAEVGIAFLHAQRHHPAMARVAPVRRSLGRRTIFNLLGPLANPARVPQQMIGVFSPAWQQPLAEAAWALGATDILVVHGSGLDEIAVHDASRLLWMRAAGTAEAVVGPADMGVAVHPLSDLAGGAPEENAAILTELFAGRRNRAALQAYHDIVAVNAAAALQLADPALGWADALARAMAALSQGAAAERLARFLDFR